MNPTSQLDTSDTSDAVKRAARQESNSAEYQILQGDLERAMEHYFKAAFHIAGFLGDPECDRLLISLSFRLSDLFANVRKREEEVLWILNLTNEAARRLGDERDLTLLNLHLGRVYFILNRLYDAVDSFNSGLAAVKKLGDDDIKIQSAEFFGILFFVQGKPGKALEYFEQAMASMDLFPESRLFNRMIPILLGSCAAFTAQFTRAIGVMDSSLRRAVLNSDTLSAPFYRAHLGNVLLMAGKRREAFAHLQEAWKEGLTHDNVYALVWALRALAYYHIQEGRPEESYKSLGKCLAEANRLGMKKPHYSLPWVLELLFEYHKRGYEPLSEYQFQKEIEIALNGINLHLRGTAFRILAQQAMMDSFETKVDRIKQLLEKSEADLESAQVPVELAKTRADMAKLKLRQGHREEAVELTLQAWEGLSIYGLKFFPKELRSLIHGRKGIVRGQQEGDDLLKRCMEMLDDLVPSANLDELLFRLIRVTSRFFEAERGAIFLVRRNGSRSHPVLGAAYNLTSNEVIEERFRNSMAYVLKAYKNDQSYSVKRHATGDPKSGHRTTAILCIPVEIRGEVRGVLYYDNTYSEGIFEFSNNTLKRIGKSLGSYVMRIQEYCKRMEEENLVALRETTNYEGLKKREIIGQSRVMKELINRTDRAARSNAPVLILGETGVGKELLARRLHRMSSRSMGPFVAVNLSSIPETLIESELFGHEKGAFTGATRRKPGRMELSHKGTLFIDEIGEIPMSLQVKLLRTLEEKTFFRLGGVKNISSDFRLVAATNRNLVKEVEAGNFREDLYYRLNVVPLIVPPLRKRGNDIVLLAEHFLNRYSKKYQRPLPELTSMNRGALRTYEWPGNVRELQNVIERTVILADIDDLTLVIPKAPKGPALAAKETDDDLLSDMPTMDELQRRYINYVIEKTNGKMSGTGGASEILGMKRTTLYTRMKKLGVSL